MAYGRAVLSGAAAAEQDQELLQVPITILFRKGWLLQRPSLVPA